MDKTKKKTKPSLICEVCHKNMACDVRAVLICETCLDNTDDDHDEDADRTAFDLLMDY